MSDEKTRMTPAAVGALLNGDYANALIAVTPGGIEAQEAAGQRDLVSSSARLPLRCNYPEDGRKILESWGVKFIGPADDLFEHVELPPGWTMAAEGHAMWSNVQDEQGRKRVGIFYKAAFYDRNAHYSLKNRYRVQRDWKRDAEGVAVSVVLDAGREIFRTGEVMLPKERGREFFEVGHRSDEAAQAWLTATFSEWRNPAAYWSEASK